MMDFNSPVERRGTSSFKWDGPGQTPDTIPLWVADMDFPSPPAVTEALLARARHPVYGYTFVPEGLYDAFIEWQRRRNGWKIERDWIVFAPGVVPALHFAIEAYTKEGDGVVVQTPVYRPFFRAVEIMNRSLVLNPLRREGDRYGMDLDGLASALNGGVKLLLLCSPHNPVARVWTEEELKELGSLCAKRGVLIVSDDIHADLIMPGRRFTPLAGLGDDFAANSVTCASPSKTFNIPGTGYAFVVIPDPERRTAFRKAGARVSALDLPNLFSVAAAEAAYRQGEEWLDSLIPYLWENYLFLKEFLAERLPEVRVFPQEGTYVVWLDFRGFGRSEADLGEVLAREARVKLSAGWTFGAGGEGFQRLNIACPRGTLKEGLERIAAALKGGEE